MTLHPSSHVGRIVITLVISGAMAGGVVAEANGPFAEGALEMRGTRLTIYDDGAIVGAINRCHT